MEASIISASSHSPPPCRSGAPRLPVRRIRIRCASSSKNGSNYGWDFGGGSVDANIVMLRKRIHEMEMAERNYQQLPPPQHWADWEKRCYTRSYDAEICKVVGVVQTMLMNTRPSFAVGIAAMLAFGVPASAAFILYHVIEASGAVLAGIHLG